MDVAAITDLGDWLHLSDVLAMRFIIGQVLVSDEESTGTCI